jgi:hypothetical protein
VGSRPVGEAREAAGDERVGGGDRTLVLGAEIGELGEVLERLADLVGARIEAVIDGG